MRKLGVEEWLVSAVMSMYTGAKTVVRTVCGNSRGFELKVGMHQGSALSPLLAVIVMEAIPREFRVALPWDSNLKQVGNWPLSLYILLPTFWRRPTNMYKV